MVYQHNGHEVNVVVHQHNTTDLFFVITWSQHEEDDERDDDHNKNQTPPLYPLQQDTGWVRQQSKAHSGLICRLASHQIQHKSDGNNAQHQNSPFDSCAERAGFMYIP
jgi:hypothetical protein